MSSELKVDTVNEKTPNSGVTIEGVIIKDGELVNVTGESFHPFLLMGS